MVIRLPNLIIIKVVYDFEHLFLLKQNLLTAPVKKNIVSFHTGMVTDIQKN